MSYKKILIVPNFAHSHIITQTYELLQYFVMTHRNRNLNCKLAKKYAEEISKNPRLFRDYNQDLCICTDYCTCGENTAEMYQKAHPLIFQNQELIKLLKMSHQLKISSKEYRDDIKRWKNNKWIHLSDLL